MADHIPSLRPATDQDSDLCFDIKKKAFGEYVEEIWGWDEDV